MAHPLHPTITLGRLREELRFYGDDYEISFGGLDYFKVSERGPKFLQLEFNQPVHRLEDGRVVIGNLD